MVKRRAKVADRGHAGAAVHTPSASSSWRPAQTPAQSSAWRPTHTPGSRSPGTGPIRKTSIKRGPIAAMRGKAMSTPGRTVATRKGSSKVELGAQSSKSGPTETASGKPVLAHLVWTCNLCGETLRGRLQKSLTCARLRHVKKVHPKQATSVNQVLKRSMQTAVASEELPAQQRVWSCPKCNKGLPSLSKRALKASQEAHLMQCYSMSRAKNCRASSISTHAG